MGANLLAELVVLQLKGQLHDRQGLLKAAKVGAAASLEIGSVPELHAGQLLFTCT
jgi:hypothetical protein